MKPFKFYPATSRRDKPNPPVRANASNFSEPVENQQANKVSWWKMQG
jgi:hypothetical protein